jgi:predicted GIY-YIG superfamily endonuclease
VQDFHVYILRCADGSYYTGMTDNLDQRLAQHDAGTFPGYTHNRRPLTLMWNACFPTRTQAYLFERQIKNWSRAKKEALMAGDWDGLRAAARSRTTPA